MTKELALRIRDMLLEFSGKIDESVRLVKDTCPEDEFRRYRSGTAQIMGAMYAEVLRPLFREHPELEPESMKSTSS